MNFTDSEDRVVKTLSSEINRFQVEIFYSISPLDFQFVVC